MLIPFSSVYQYIQSLGKSISGILHVGAHLCEEKDDYNRHGIQDKDIIWIDGNMSLVKQLKELKIPNIYHALIDEKEVSQKFYITNNGQSSSLLELGEHATLYPHVVVSETQIQNTIRIDTFFKTNNIDPSLLNFWNFDIQGVELQALKSAGDLLKFAEFLYLEVNTQEIYKGCSKLNEIDYFLEEKGFQRIAMQIYDNDGWGDAFYVRIRS